MMPNALVLKLGSAFRLLAFGMKLLHKAKNKAKTLDSYRDRKLNVY